MAAYQRYETELFTEQLAGLGNAEREQVEGAIEKLLEHPELNDGQLKGDRAGCFKKKVVKKKYRIIFRYCDFCLQTKKRRCSDCEGFPQNVVIFEDVFYRGDGYD